MEEDMMMLMMKIRRTNQTDSSHSHSHSLQPNINISFTTNPTWKLYENPFYILSSHNQQQQKQSHSHDHNNQIHNLHLPISTQKFAASFRDLTFIKPLVVMDQSQLELARSQINELKAEIECERKIRKKLESSNKRLTRELSEEIKGRQSLERLCQELVSEISYNQTEINRMKKEIEEERKMLRIAEVIREERVQMKLAEAKILMEENFSQYHHKENNSALSFGEKLRFVLGEKRHVPANAINSMALMKKRGCLEAENPHIKRGIRGFVEFPKVVRAIGCTSSKHLGSKMECQKAQLKILLKQKGPVRFNGLTAS